MNITSIVAIIGFIQGLFLLTVLIPKVKKSTPSFYAALLLSVFIFDLGTYWLHINNLISKLTLLIGFAETTLFLYGPILYLYVSSVLNVDKLVTLKSNLFHFIPAVIVFSLVSPFLFGYPINDFLNRLGDSMPEFFSTYNLSSLIFDHVIWFTHAIIYFIACLRMLRRYRISNSKNLRASDQTIKKLHYRWIEFLIFGYLAFPIIGLTGFTYGLISGEVMNFSPVLNLFLVFHIFGISFIGFRHQQLLTNPMKMIKYQQSNMDDERLNLCIKKLTDYFENERPYLKNDLTIKSVASHIGIIPNYISEAINRHYGYGFNDFVNSYRIELVKKLIVSTEKDIYTLEALANEVGFKSKPTFNTAFKKKEGITPSEFRKIHR
jgi:AraC-like DNA-binding protein